MGGVGPDAGTRVDPEDLRILTTGILGELGLPEDDARRIARCLVQVDLRGVFSHGTGRLKGYVDQYRKGALNKNPHIRVLRDDASIAVLDGDGGLGYLAAIRGAGMLVEKTAKQGLAAVTTRNHGHAGSLGVYARLALRESLVFFAAAGGRTWQKPSDPGATVWDAMSSPPICLGVPTAEGPPLVVDMSANFFRDRTRLDDAVQDFPEAVLKSMGLKFAATLIGGVLGGGISGDEVGGDFSGATRGTTMLALQPNAVGDGDHFLGETARIVDSSRSLAPLPGQRSAEVAGSLEWERERAWMQQGIPLENGHLRALETLAGEAGIPIPWQRR